ncbi:50S ribosomal protein L25 [Quillaja saponaria]|uniref:50S ribosomal protein L25 n=1 Tax=Quillaja saponaria TaxID=32244 RepID=A0AAD7P6X9_QUISA|nr:50S ribosomal protein L25 [Quillaja saponaria]
MAKWWRSTAGHVRTVVTNQRASSSILQFQSASYHTIQAIPREYTGSRVSTKDRIQGRTPAVVFTQNLLDRNPTSRQVSRKHLLTAETKQIKAILNSIELPFFCSTRFPLQIRAGSGSSHLLESGNVLPIKIHRDEETGKILNLVFVWADDGSELKVDVPVVFKGEDVCPGLNKGGSLNRFRTSLKYLCPAEHIPPKIEVDVSNLDIGDRVFMRDVEVHPSLKLLSKNETMPICKIVPTSLGNQEPTGWRMSCAPQNTPHHQCETQSLNHQVICS